MSRAEKKRREDPARKARKEMIASAKAVGKALQRPMFEIGEWLSIEYLDYQQAGPQAGPKYTPKYTRHNYGP